MATIKAARLILKKLELKFRWDPFLQRIKISETFRDKKTGDPINIGVESIYQNTGKARLIKLLTKTYRRTAFVCEKY